MKKITELDFGFNDVVNYKKPGYKPILDRFSLWSVFSS